LGIFTYDENVRCIKRCFGLFKDDKTSFFGVINFKERQFSFQYGLFLNESVIYFGSFSDNIYPSFNLAIGEEVTFEKSAKRKYESGIFEESMNDNMYNFKLVKDSILFTKTLNTPEALDCEFKIESFSYNNFTHIINLRVLESKRVIEEYQIKFLNNNKTVLKDCEISVILEKGVLKSKDSEMNEVGVITFKDEKIILKQSSSEFGYLLSPPIDKYEIFKQLKEFKIFDIYKNTESLVTLLQNFTNEKIKYYSIEYKNLSDDKQVYFTIDTYNNTITKFHPNTFLKKTFEYNADLNFHYLLFNPIDQYKYPLNETRRTPGSSSGSCKCYLI
jgi:hypothetical protein